MAAQTDQSLSVRQAASERALEKKERQHRDGGADHQNEDEHTGIRAFARFLRGFILAALRSCQQVHYHHDDEGGDEKLNQIAHEPRIARGLVQ